VLPHVTINFSSEEVMKSIQKTAGEMAERVLIASDIEMLNSLWEVLPIFVVNMPYRSDKRCQVWKWNVSIVRRCPDCKFDATGAAWATV
jgi:hypothetical protein